MEEVEEFKDNNTKEKDVKETKKDFIKPLFTSRLLFISVLDKVFIVVLMLMFLLRMAVIFEGDVTSLNYDYFERVGLSIINIFVMLFVSLICYLIYLCAAKTMLCVTDKQVYCEYYIPFVEGKVSIPLDKITKVETVDVFFIFRSIIIYQYGKLPFVFFTWTNKEFKENLDKKIKVDTKEIENNVEFKEIFSKKNAKKLGIVAIIYIAVLLIIGVSNLIGIITSDERKLLGTYEIEGASIEFKENGSCKVINIGEKEGFGYSWTYDEEEKEIIVEYKTTEKSYYFGTYDKTNYLNFEFRPKENAVVKDNIVYKKNK